MAACCLATLWDFDAQMKWAASMGIMFFVPPSTHDRPSEG
jgi:hypothetical protein